MSGPKGTKKGKTRIGQPKAKPPAEKAVEEETAEETEVSASQPSPTSEPGSAPDTPLQSESEEIKLTNEVEGDDEDKAAESAPAAVATPPPSLPMSATTPMPSAEQVATPPQTPPRKKWFTWPERWKRADTNAAVLCILCVLFWTTVIIMGLQYGSEVWDFGKNKTTIVANGAKAKATRVAQVFIPALKTAKPTPAPLKQSVIECRNYTVTRELDGSRSTKNCKCINDNCPKKTVCRGDQYKVTYNWKTVSNPDGTNQRIVNSTTVDTSNCERTY
jgi:hypothetical protein